MSGKLDWQDIMIRYFGGDWLADSYGIEAVGKMAEEIANLEARIASAKEVIEFYANPKSYCIGDEEYPKYSFDIKARDWLREAEGEE